ncbi:MAG TPA: uroporphyrinogen decarboxylase [Saprospiraceae bacterium]|nr:uroporphyrinogen decarboxylase [Saprospiraceae bacterium]MCB9329266.1 uroporphyrinogen decarboxylase [Lewinellaceae bacterium]HRX28688.1 uroporphyrinogen decarboxylase [Saprospiraceae bacterium]
MQVKNDLLLRTVKGEKVERPPVWLMRQAGRILPQYRAVRNSLNGFIALVKNPELVAEVTIQPVDELGVDAAILFSDILVIPEAMGLPYELVEKKGPYFPKVIQSKSDIEALTTEVNPQLDYVFGGIDKTLEKLEGRVPLIGFSGAPFTLFCYMIEGSGSKTFSKAKRFLYQEPELSHQLLQKITTAIIQYTNEKVNRGVHLIQIFDSWAGVLDEQSYREFCIPYLREIVQSLKPRVPVTLFSKGAWFALHDIQRVGADVIGLDWNISPSQARDLLGREQVVQGNLDPCMLYADDQMIENATIKMIQEFGRNHIVNLGHGVYPDTPLDKVKTFVNCVKSFRY